MKITWLGHGTFEFEWGSGKKLVADPWVEGNPSYPKDHKFTGIDLMIVSHGHFDHIHDAVPLAKKFKPEVAGIFELCHWLESKGAKNTKPMNKGGAQVFFEGQDEVRITMTHALHRCGILDGDKIIYVEKQRASCCVPMHFASLPMLTGTPGALEKLVDPAKTEIWTLEPGKTVVW